MARTLWRVSQQCGGILANFILSDKIPDVNWKFPRTRT